MLARIFGGCGIVARACASQRGMAFLALCLSAGAGIVLTGVLIFNIIYMQEQKRSDDIAHLSIGVLLLLSIMMLSLHRLLGSRQAIALEVLHMKLSMTQGESNDAA